MLAHWETEIPDLFKSKVEKTQFGSHFHLELIWRTLMVNYDSMPFYLRRFYFALFIPSDHIKLIIKKVPIFVFIYNYGKAFRTKLNLPTFFKIYITTLNV